MMAAPILLELQQRANEILEYLSAWRLAHNLHAEPSGIPPRLAR